MNDISTHPDLRREAGDAALFAVLPTPAWLVDTGTLRARGGPDPAHARLGLVEVIEANPAALALLGSEDPRHLFAGVIDVLSGQRRVVAQASSATADGDVRELAMTFTALPGAQDMILVTAQDITERLRAEAQLRQLRAELAHVARISILGELATSIAHEVRQPLAAIATNADTSLRWLARPDPNLAKVAELTARISASAQRASDIIQRVRGMAQKHAPERVALDLARVAEEAVAFVRHDLDTRGVELSLTVAPGLAPVMGDPVQLQQVVVNLLVNALQAIDRPDAAARRIVLDVEAADGAAVVSVRDSGPGIADADLARLFEGFFTTKPAGLGVGLTICRSIVSEHGGEISAANDPDGGAVFRVILPFDPAAS